MPEQNQNGETLIDLIQLSLRFKPNIVDLSRKVRIDRWLPYTAGHTLICTTVSHHGSKHGQVINNLTPNSSILTGKLSVTCSCQDYKYRWDYALYTKNASPGVASDKIPARINNPRNTPALCKHLFRVLSIAYVKARQGTF